MSNAIDQYIAQNNSEETLAQCLRENQIHLGLLLAHIFQTTNQSVEFYRLFTQLNDAVTNMKTDGDSVVVSENMISADNPPLVEEHSVEIHEAVQSPHTGENTRVMLLCNWCSSENLCDTWNKMSKGNYTWNSIQLVWEEPAEWYVIINCPPISIIPDPQKSIVFQMEPHMAKNPLMWGDWAKPAQEQFKFLGTHANHYNNNEWHLSKTYSELSTEEIAKDEKIAGILSTVLSDKYQDPGHVKRVDFVQFLEKKGLDVHVYGGNKFEWKNYKGSPPYHQKDEAMLPYKYVFNAENHEIRNYYTEKLIDGILAECLVFYWGCPNIRDFFDPRALVQLNLVDFEKDFQTIKTAITEDWWSQRLPYIKEAKNKILNELQFFPRLEKILSE